MTLAKFAKPLAWGLIVAAAALGCHKDPTPITKLPAGAKTGTPNDIGPGNALGANNPSGADITGTPSNDPDAHKDWPRNAEVFAADTVHFDFDSSVIKAEEQPKVSAVADNLKANSASAVEIDGHCDERGTEEYNRSLGERRALALREEMIRLGIDPTRVDTLSYGFNRPADTGHDESAWKKNRRGEFVLLTPPAKP